MKLNLPDHAFRAPEIYWCRAASTDTTSLDLHYPVKIVLREIPDEALSQLTLHGPTTTLCCKPIIGGPFPGLCMVHWLEWRKLTWGERRKMDLRRAKKKG